MSSPDQDPLPFPAATLRSETDRGSTLWQPLDRRGGHADLLRVWDGSGFISWSWEEWLRRALCIAAGLRAGGMRRGDRVACLLTNGPAACAGVLGVWFAGGCVVSMPLIARGMAPPAYFELVRKAIGASESVMLLCERATRPLLTDAALSVPAVSFEDLQEPTPADPEPLDDHEPAFVQFSSGSTSDPKGIVLTPRAIRWQLDALARSLRINADEDTGVVWLPLAHDMGLFGCLLLTYWTGHRLVFSSPQRFLQNPASWFEDCARFGATVSATPSFALSIATRMAESRLPPPFPMRRLVIGGERIDPAVLERANRILGDERLPLDALVPAYGLAEAVLAVTMTALGEGPRIVKVDRDQLAAGQVERGANAQAGGMTTQIVSAGLPLEGSSVAVRPGSRIGEIFVKSPSLAVGYVGAPELTAARFTAAGLATGDLGFILDGELMVTGRLDDLICVAGRNIYARDIEAAIAAAPGTRPGGCAVVDVDRHGETSLVAVVELRDAHTDQKVVAQAIRECAHSAVGITLRECVFVSRGQLPKTPSGKIQRFRCREIADATAASSRRHVIV